MTAPPAIDELEPPQVVAKLEAWARELGFQQLAVATVELDADMQRFAGWIGRGMHGTMSYLERNQNLRSQPSSLVENSLSVISVRMDYMSETPEQAITCLNEPTQAYVSRYALGRDYHKVIRQRLKRLAERLQALIGPFGFRAFTDSAPILERALARNAGLGWIGKHTNVLNRGSGSLFFLGELFTDLKLPEKTHNPDNHCGSCTRCIDVCPTRAIVKPYELDARLCISYLTIESKQAIPEELRSAIGNRVFGCDDCQLFCPWNRYAQKTTVSDFSPRHSLQCVTLMDLFALDHNAFDELTRGSALRRISYEQWLRNLAVGLGNAPADSDIVDALQARSDHASALVREHVHWAINKQQTALKAAAAGAPP